GECRDVREQVRGIAAVARHAGRTLDVLARELVTAPALRTIVACAAEPADAHPRARGAGVDIGAYGIDCADHFVSRDTRILESRHVPLDRQGIAVTHATGVYADAHFVSRRLR